MRSEIRFPFPKIKTVEDKDTGNALVLQDLDLLFDIGSERKWEASKSNEEGLFCRMVIEVLIKVVGSINAYDSTFEGCKR